MDHWVVFTSLINPYYTDFLTSIDSDSGMHLNMFFWSQHHRAELLWRGRSSRLGRCEGQAPGLCQLHELISPPGGLCRKGSSGIPRFNSTHCPSFPAQDWGFNSFKAFGSGFLLSAALYCSDTWANDYFPDSRAFASHHPLQCELLMSAHIPQDWFWSQSCLGVPWPCQVWATNTLSQIVHAEFHSWASNGEWRKKNFLTGIIRTDTVPIKVLSFVEKDVWNFGSADLHKMMLVVLT